MKIKLLFTAVTVVIVASATGYAQDARQEPVPSASQARQQKPTSPARKVWTNDDVMPLRWSGGVQVREKDGRAGGTAARQAGPAKQTDGAKPAQAGTPAALSNPKTLEDADKMIAWENRDIEAQQEFVDRLQKELHEAPVDQRERLEKLLQERTQILADLRKEQERLVTQRKGLEKKGGAENTAASSQPPN
jgi:hypothetical protein